MPKRHWLTLGFAATAALTALLTGCSSPSAATPITKTVHPALHKPEKTTGTRPQFENLLLMDPTPLVSKMNTMPVISVTADEHIHVQESSGRWTTLDAMTHPVLFVAYWCPHCQRTLVMLQKNASHMTQWPTIVFTGYPPGFPLKWAKAIEAQELRALHLHFIKDPLYLIGNADMKYITGFPYLMFKDNGKLTSLVGEHTFPVWQRAITMR
ncbi:MAG: hypothetical protein OWT28_11150 [Firmicutes bacterium]|nr:hypothetical protein [Bacillota bacterium]